VEDPLRWLAAVELLTLLPARQRETCLAILKASSYHEISKQINARSNTVAARLSRAYATLVRRLFDESNC
jgi:DNA-directed RNA polymerase specialized sigma24 family protein